MCCCVVCCCVLLNYVLCVVVYMCCVLCAVCMSPPQTFQRDPAVRPDAEVLLRHPFVNTIPAGAVSLPLPPPLLLLPLLLPSKGSMDVSFEAHSLRHSLSRAHDCALTVTHAPVAAACCRAVHAHVEHDARGYHNCVRRCWPGAHSSPQAPPTSGWCVCISQSP